jgi:hypothetical protein
MQRDGGGGGAQSPDGDLLCYFLCRRRIPCVTRPRLPPTGIGHPRQPFREGGARNQRRENTDDDLHPRPHSHPTTGGIISEDATGDRLGSRVGHADGPMSRMRHCHQRELHAPPPGGSARHIPRGSRAAGVFGTTPECAVHSPPPVRQQARLPSAGMPWNISRWLDDTAAFLGPPPFRSSGHPERGHLPPLQTVQYAG